jgi:hypothetical protein
MIVAFVIDTSPSMGKHVVAEGHASNSMTRLDLAKMATEEIVKGLKRRIIEHNGILQQASPRMKESLCNIGLGFVPRDDLLLLSTGRQHTSQLVTADCGAGGRLLVGFGDPASNETGNNPMMDLHSQGHHPDSFQRELKQLKATAWAPPPSEAQQGQQPIPFPEDGGGANGLNQALSAGMQMLMRYRLRFKETENFAMGRLPSPAIMSPSGGGTAIHALQPACLILITDGECLNAPPEEGGGSLTLSTSQVLRDFYQEPFRWDQRVFCLSVGGQEGSINPQLRALVEVTGGFHTTLTQSSLSKCSDRLVKLIAPPKPKNLPLVDPLSFPPPPVTAIKGANGTFTNGGPIVTFQAFEPDENTGKNPPKNRAMLLYIPQNVGDNQSHDKSTDAAINDSNVFQPPVWCIPESFFPSKKLDTLPPRSAQPNLLFSRYPSRLGSRCFEASAVVKMLHKLDQVTLAIHKLIMQSAAPSSHQSRLLKRDTYICEWLSLDDKTAKVTVNPEGMEYFPVLVAGAGRPTLSSGDASYLSIGVLHVPHGTSSLSSSLTAGVRVSTLTLLPPEPHVLLPLLIRAAEAEHRVLKKIAASLESSTGIPQKQASTASRSVQLDEGWRNEFRAYLFRLPPYYQNGLKRSLRSILPASAHSLLNAEDVSLAMQCYSKVCQQKIRNAEQMVKQNNERLERQEAELRRRVIPNLEGHQQPKHTSKSSVHPDLARSSLPIKYGHYDPRSSVESYLSALRSMPAPWKVPSAATKLNGHNESLEKGSSDPVTNQTLIASDKHPQNAMEVLGDLPAKCLMAFYESRRRWIFGGSGLATRGLYVEGVSNDGSNVQRCEAERNIMNESLLSFAGVGVSQLNVTTTAKMGDYRERLLWSRAPVVGYGSNDSFGVSGTTSQNGEPVWSVDDDAMPIPFFNPITGEFVDSVHARVRSRLSVNFGNPYKDKRADSLIPEKFLDQRPRLRSKEDNAGSPLTPPTSPPHDSYAEMDGEGEAIFAVPVSRRSPRRESNDIELTPITKRQKIDSNTKSEGQHLDLNADRAVPKQTQPPSQDSGIAGTSVLSSSTPPPPPGRPQLVPRLQQSHERRRSLGPHQPPPPPSATVTVSANAPVEPQMKRDIQADSHRSNQARPPPPARSKSTPAPSKTQGPFLSQASQPGNAERPPPVSQGAPDTSTVDMQSPGKQPDVKLPPGWMCVWSKSQKRWYFFDTKTNKSVWQWPPP